MRALLDVNVLIALLDRDHSFHEQAATWLDQHAHHGWASCPLTQNGCIRVMSGSAYPGTLPVEAIAQRLRTAAATDMHEFWPDDLSVLDERIVDTTRIHGPRQLTDTYLLALAVKRKGTFVTFDRSIALAAVTGATKAHLRFV